MSGLLRRMALAWTLDSVESVHLIIGSATGRPGMVSRDNQPTSKPNLIHLSAVEAVPTVIHCGQVSGGRTSRIGSSIGEYM